MLYRKGMLHQNGSKLGLIHRVIEAAMIVGALWICGYAYGVPFEMHYQLAGMVGMAVFLFLAEWNSLYLSWRANSIGREAWMISSLWVLSCCVMLAVVFLSKSSEFYSRVTITAWMMFTPIFLMGERIALRSVLRRFRMFGFNTRAVAIVGGGTNAAKLVEVISTSPWMGLRIEGIYDDAETIFKDEGGCEVRGQGMEVFMQHIQDRSIDCVYITYPMQQEERIRQLVERLADSTTSVHVVPDVFVSDLFHARWTSVGEVPLVSVFESSIYGGNALLKRLEDVVLGILILVLISPVLMVISIAVKLTSPGPVFFKQRRYGLNGQVIEVWKFRSMSVMEDGANIQQAQKNDPRVTPLGRILRRTSLDELPQFVNVLQGRMSIVGPRPHAVSHNEQYRKLIHGYMLRHKVKPGITGWAQVNGWRGETDTVEKMEKRVECDLYYINNWSLFLDIKIIAMTVLGGMRGKNAY